MPRTLFALFTLIPLLAQGGPYQDPRDQISIIRNDLKNLEVEFHQLKEHVSNQDAALDMVQSDVAAASEAQKHSPLEAKLDTILSELKSIKSHANKLADEIEANRQKNLQLDADFSSLQGALASVMDALGIEGTSGKSYTVQPGDSLGGIAQKNKTTIQALKKANRLNGDKIFVGQKLKLP